MPWGYTDSEWKKMGIKSIKELKPENFTNEVIKEMEKVAEKDSKKAEEAKELKEEVIKEPEEIKTLEILEKPKRGRRNK